MNGPGWGVGGPAFEGDGAQFLEQINFRLVGVDIAHGVEQSVHLSLRGLDDRGVGVAGGGDPERGGQIEVALVVDVPDVDALSAIPDDGPLTFGVDEGDVGRFEGR